jgi:predicted nucleotidyltransferase
VVSLIVPRSLLLSMSTVRVALPLFHCYRCIFSWHPTTPVIRICPRCKSKNWDVPKVRLPPYDGGGVGIPEIIAPKRKQIRALVRKHGFAKPRVFGSVARGEAGPKSDVDILVRSWRGDILDRVALARELGELLGREVDVVPDQGLKWYAAPEIMAQAVPV